MRIRVAEAAPSRADEFALRGGGVLVVVLVVILGEEPAPALRVLHLCLEQHARHVPHKVETCHGRRHQAPWGRSTGASCPGRIEQIFKSS